MLTFRCESQAHTTKTRRGTGTEQRHQSSIKPPDEDKKQSRENTKKSHKENQKYQKETQEHYNDTKVLQKDIKPQKYL